MNATFNGVKLPVLLKNLNEQNLFLCWNIVLFSKQDIVHCHKVKS